MKKSDYLGIAAGHWPRQEAWPAYARGPGMIAVHEAGHLVADLALGVTQADLVAVSHGTHGEVQRADRTGTPGAVADLVPDPDAAMPECFKVAVLQRAAMFLAGHAAEIEAAEQDVTGWPWPLMDQPDLQNAVAFLGLAWPHRIDGPLAAAWMLARDTLRHEWPWLLRVASVVEQTGRCTAEDARMLR